jgi:hypothetical protein
MFDVCCHVRLLCPASASRLDTIEAAANDGHQAGWIDAGVLGEQCIVQGRAALVERPFRRPYQPHTQSYAR